ncbi:teichuronic acid biosynthesis protein TuaC [Heyndrickxia camelliae]|uniref:Glycosyltransferase family 4 protein n=1 Tax=Heyndrickxia camelliae TaxID=1707093 RepID=A0A2N3LJ18_9BACI|nr:glycosyltransferase [Heyndrickxia camelliae]PKR84606.1 glycosyltransferase family 4 protein [Heyndrickxia camelliae]
MKVLWITSNYPSDEQPGSGVFHETQVQALLKLGVEVTVISPIPRNLSLFRYMRKQYRAKSNIPFRYIRKGVTVYRPIYLAFPGQLRWAQPHNRIAQSILKTLSVLDIEFDLIHAHFAMPSGGAASVVSKQKRIPWVLTLHGSDVNIYPNFSKSARKMFVNTVIEANHVMAVDVNLQKKTNDVTGRDSIVLPIGIDLERYQKQEYRKQDLRRRLRIPIDKKLILFVGRLVENKGVFELAQALESLPDEVAVVYVGDGSAAEQLRQNPELNRRLFLTGQIENERVKEYLLASDVLALPSYSEGMPTVVIEALASKVPVISTAVGGVPDLFSTYPHYLIEKKSVSSLVERIQDVLYRNLYTDESQQELLEIVNKNYDAQKNASLLMDVYTQAIKSTN